MLAELDKAEQEMASVCSCVRVGDISLALTGNSRREISLSVDCAKFCSETLPAEIEVRVEFASTLGPASRTPEFDSGAVWKLFRDDSGFVIDFINIRLSSSPYKRMWVEHNTRHARIALNLDLVQDDGAVYPLEYPADELLITNYLASRGLGLEVHGCGVIDAEYGGQLFLGHSGAGKSTTTRIWETFRNPEILSDDRLILRLHDGELWMYGTPWHGEAAFASPGRAKLNRIFILQQGRQNAIRELSKAQAAGEIFARSFPPFHSPVGLERTLEFIHRALTVVPCYEFQFLPDKTAVETVLAFHD